MEKSKKVSSTIAALISVLVLGYILFVAVYNQIIAQSDGFFNMIIFGGILLLVFILISLIAKLLAVSPKNESSPFLKYFIYILMIFLSVVCVFMALRYNTSYDSMDSISYKGAVSIIDGTLQDESELSVELNFNPSDYIYAKVISVLFNFTGEVSEYVIYLNIALQLLIAFSLFFAVKRLTNFICGFLAFCATCFMPAISFSVYSYNSELYFAFIFALALHLFCNMIYKHYKSTKVAVCLSVLFGLILGLLVFSNISFAIVAITMIVIMIIKNRPSIECGIISFVTAFIVVFASIFEMSYSLNMTFGGTMVRFFSRLNPFRNRVADQIYSFTQISKFFSDVLNNQNRSIVNNFYHLSTAEGNSISALQSTWIQFGNHLLYMFLIILAISGILYLANSKYTRLLPMYYIFIGTIISIFCTCSFSTESNYFCVIMITIGAGTIHHMYLHHHPDYSEILIKLEEEEFRSVSEEDISELNNENGGLVSANDDKTSANTLNEEINSDENVRRARALIFIGENDELYAEIKQKEKEERMQNEIATRLIKTQILDDGKYESKIEHVEYFDVVDNSDTIKPAVAPVIPIPASRPVEVVKPIVAEDEGQIIENAGYFDSPDDDVYRQALREELRNRALQAEEMKKNQTDFMALDDYESDEKDSEYLDDPDNHNIMKPLGSTKDKKKKVLFGGFVFRKNKSEIDELEQVDSTTIEEVEETDNTENSNTEDNKKSIDVISVSRGEKAKKGEKLHNPLPVPKPVERKEMDYDYADEDMSYSDDNNYESDYSDDYDDYDYDE